MQRCGEAMTFYHGSPVGGLNELKPFLSEHGNPYAYFTTNPLVALLYAVKPVPKPFSFYPYGFDEKGTVFYSDYYEDAFYNLYKNRVGYLYECDHLKGLEKPTQIKDAKPLDKFQFVRNGFFSVDTKYTTDDKLVFNRVVPLKSSFKPGK